MLSMTDTLAQDVPIMNSTRGEINSSGEITYPPEAVPGLEYFVLSKYQNNLSRTSFLVCLIQLHAVRSNIGEWESDLFMFDSEYS
jgi:hypothetical protein